MVCVSDRDRAVVAYLTAEEKQALTSQAQSESKSQSEVLRAAIMEYLDRDKTTRVESKVDRIDAKLDRVVGALAGDGNTHTHSQTASETVQKTREIAQRITRNHEDPVRELDVRRAIEDIAGGDERTLQKYQRKLKERQLLFKHPSSSGVWTSDKWQWVYWVDDYVDATPDAVVSDYTVEYGIEIEQFDEIAMEVREQ